MRIGSSLNQSLTAKLEQRLNLQQLILTEQILNLPAGSLDTLLVAMASNPERSESVIQSQPKNAGDRSGDRLRSFYADFVGSQGTSLTNNGVIPTFNPVDLGVLFGKEAEMRINPDVIYLGRENEKPRIEFAPHIAP